MVEIAEEAYREAEAKMDNATDLQRRYAIIAILNGTPPEEVAAACGFKPTSAGISPNEPPEFVKRMLGMPSSPTDVERFSMWICRWLHQQIIGYQPQTPTGGAIIYRTDEEKEDDDE